MEKNRYHVVILVVFCIFIILLPACKVFNNSARTELVINKDGSGYRLISCKLKPSSIKKYIIGGEEAFDKFLEKNCPKEIDFKKRSTDIDLYYDFYIKFNSIEEYRNKVCDILSRQNIQSFYVFDNVFATGISIREDFSSADVLSWIKDKLSECCLLSEDGPLWEYGENRVSFNNTYYDDLKENIELYSLEYSPIDKIDIYTEIKNDNSFNRELRFYISDEVLNNLGAAALNYMDSKVPKNSSKEWLHEDGKSYSVFKINFTALNTSDLSEKMDMILSLDQNKSELKYEEASILSAIGNFTEHLNFSAFPSNKSGKTYVNYTVKLEENQSIYNAKNKNNLEWHESENAKNSHFFTLNEEMNNLDIMLVYGAKRPICNVELRTQILSNELFKREITLNFEENANNTNNIENIRKHFEKMNLEFLGFSSQENSCTISLKGSLKDINAYQKTVLGEGNEILLDNDNSFKLHNVSAITDQVDLSRLLADLDCKNQIKYQISSYNKFTKYSSKDNYSNKFSDYLTDNGEIETVLMSDGNFCIISESKNINISFICVMSFIAFVFLIFLIFFVHYMIFSNRKNYAMQQENTQNMPKFLFSGYICPNCRAPLYLDMQYCSLCGQKIKLDE